MFSHEQLSSFCAVFDKGSFSAGARLLQKDRSTVREHISIMEDTIGVPLFVVEGRSAKPTETAYKLYPRAMVLVKQLKEFCLEAYSSFEHEISVLNVFYDAMIPSGLIASVEQGMGSAWPSIRINWLQRSDVNRLMDW